MSSDDETDFGADTQMFQAFVDRHREPEPSRTGARWALAIGALAVVIALLLALVMLL